MPNLHLEMEATPFGLITCNILSTMSVMTEEEKGAGAMPGEE